MRLTACTSEVGGKAIFDPCWPSELSSGLARRGYGKASRLNALSEIQMECLLDEPGSSLPRRRFLLHPSSLFLRVASHGVAPTRHNITCSISVLTAALVVQLLWA